LVSEQAHGFIFDKPNQTGSCHRMNFCAVDCAAALVGKYYQAGDRRRATWHNPAWISPGELRVSSDGRLTLAQGAVLGSFVLPGELKGDNKSG
jgi:hypothetical protein